MQAIKSIEFAANVYLHPFNGVMSALIRRARTHISKLEFHILFLVYKFLQTHCVRKCETLQRQRHTHSLCIYTHRRAFQLRNSGTIHTAGNTKFSRTGVVSNRNIAEAVTSQKFRETQK